MDVAFGTSGVRGLVTDLTDAVVGRYTAAFIAACPHGGAVYVGRDLRASSPRIAEQVMRVASGAGLTVFDCGALPTPALALAAGRAGKAAIMVTGSHIPDDRNGLKFYTPSGEISKADEAAIQAALGTAAPEGDGPFETAAAAETYKARYTSAFGQAALHGLRIGVYQHSSVARDIMAEVIAALGADTVPLGRADRFIPVDTEAVDAETRDMLACWCRDHRLDAIVSTDGDADRPMVTDNRGRIIPGDVLGALTAQALRADRVVTPVSSNTMIESLPEIVQVMRTRIGSPYVIAGIESILAEDPSARVVGYEANGGFLLGFAAHGAAGPLVRLLTRDCLLPILAPLAQATARKCGLADLVAGLPHRFTASGRVAGVPSDRSKTFIAGLAQDAAQRAAFFDGEGAVTAVDETDGLRLTFETGVIVHLRPSGNAPECRCYAEADTADIAEARVSRYLEKLSAALG